MSLLQPSKVSKSSIASERVHARPRGHRARSLQPRADVLPGRPIRHRLCGRRRGSQLLAITRILPAVHSLTTRVHDRHPLRRNLLCVQLRFVVRFNPSRISDWRRRRELHASRKLLHRRRVWSRGATPMSKYVRLRLLPSSIAARAAARALVHRDARPCRRRR